MPTKSSHSFSRVKAVHLTSPILSSYNYCGNLAHKASEYNIFFRISFVIIVGNRDIKKLFVLPSFRKRSNFDYHGKIYQHFSLPFNQKPTHLSLWLRPSPPRVILVRMLRRRSTMLTRGRCFKPMSLKFKLCKMNWNHWRPNLLI
jgi:hypothetical protein